METVLILMYPDTTKLCNWKYNKKYKYELFKFSSKLTVNPLILSFLVILALKILQLQCMYICTVYSTVVYVVCLRVKT